MSIRQALLNSTALTGCLSRQLLGKAAETHAQGLLRPDFLLLGLLAPCLLRHVRSTQTAIGKVCFLACSPEHGRTP